MPWSRMPSWSKRRPRPGLTPNTPNGWPSTTRRWGHGGPDLVTEILDPVLLPLGFAPGQVGVVAERGQVIFCRGEIESADGGCVDLVVEVEATPDWQSPTSATGGFRATDGTSTSTEVPALLISLAGLAQILPTELE
jgi:hypothetical protein